ncbi:hypothetical protein [Roseateles asaccharophilus]|uniref:Uncharacterized protein n=1 Tax=Roseateles asaccharophilus TaxID=582607 RepID=A0ABU2A2L6_9BURK|nr:hypothetical protein [Roseateles asaccharophilus]MDR7331265.1 hypothetical protein [Roseateles asaccharophilus]
MDLEIANLALLCRVRLLELPELKRVLDNDASVCGHADAAAFAKLCGLVFLHYDLEQRLADGLGAERAQAVIAQVHQHLTARLGGRLQELC